MPPYSNVPGLVQWAKDSSCPEHAKNPKSDPVIHRIDEFIASLERTTDDGQKKYMLCELFFSTNYWLRNMGQPVPSRYKLETAVKRLRYIVQKTLAVGFRCAYGDVPAVLSRYYGCPLTAHGIYVDSENVVAKADYERFKIHFQKGLAQFLTFL